MFWQVHLSKFWTKPPRFQVRIKASMTPRSCTSSSTRYAGKRSGPSQHPGTSKAAIWLCIPLPRTFRRWRISTSHLECLTSDQVGIPAELEHIRYPLADLKKCWVVLLPPTIGQVLQTHGKNELGTWLFSSLPAIGVMTADKAGPPILKLYVART